MKHKHKTKRDSPLFYEAKWSAVQEKILRETKGSKGVLGIRDVSKEGETERVPIDFEQLHGCCFVSRFLPFPREARALAY